MHVTGSHDRLVELFTKAHDLPVQIHDIFHGINRSYLVTFYHKGIVPKWLDFQIIIEIHNLRNRLIRLSIQKCPVKLPGFTGASHDQSFPVLI